MTYARSLGWLSMIYSELGDLTRAIYFHKRAFAIYLKTLPRNHYEFVFHSIQTTYIYWQNGQYEFARDVLGNISSLVEQALPPNYPFNALRLHIMGLVQYSLNNREQSIHYFKQSLQMREFFQAPDHPYVARTCYELSKLYAEENNYSTALDYAQRSLRIRKAKLPRSHQDLRQSIELVEYLSPLVAEPQVC
jgi:tetratricopeptide (TPR) repeat protein